MTDTVWLSFVQAEQVGIGLLHLLGVGGAAADGAPVFSV